MTGKGQLKEIREKGKFVVNFIDVFNDPGFDKDLEEEPETDLKFILYTIRLMYGMVYKYSENLLKKDKL